MAGVVEFEVTITGRGGHGALPDRTADPVVASAQLILALQQVVSRRTSPFEPAVVSVGAVHAGEAFNVIPDEARILGTARTFSDAAEQDVEQHIRQIAQGVAQATGTSVEVDWRRYSGPTVNESGMVEVVRRAAERVEGLHTVLTDYRTMAGEDFGDIAREVPGCFVLLGSAPADGSPAEPHHSPRFMIDEAVLDLAVELHLSVVDQWRR
jgi:amidohydrolase